MLLHFLLYYICEGQIAEMHMDLITTVIYQMELDSRRLDC